MGDMVLNQSEYEFADETGNVIARINNDGFVDAVDFVTKEGKKLSECITSVEIAGLGGGDVVGPASATNERIAVFDGTTGKLIKDGGSKISDLAPKNHASTATTYGSGTTTNYGHVKINSGDCSTNTFTNGVAAASKHSHSEMTGTASATTFYLIGHSGTTTATGKLYKNSGVYVSDGTKVCATDGFYQTSDANLKDFHGEIPVDFEKLKQIPKVYYSWKSNDNKTMYIGTSAQEVQKVYPELVATNTETGELSVDYPKLSMVALKAVDVLYEENQKMKQEMEVMKKELDLIKEKLGL